MNRTRAALRPSELSTATFPRFRDALIAAEAAGATHALRTYPGLSRVPLPRPRARLTKAFDAVVAARRCGRRLGAELPDRAALGRLCALGHGVTGPDGRGPAPSAGNLQPIELYVLVLCDGWLARSAYHYDRAAHALADLAVPLERAALEGEVPSLAQVEGGALLFLLVGDTRAVAAKYGDRAPRFLLLEAGHVMQSLALAAASVDLGLVPIGGFLEAPLAARLRLPAYDAVLYAALAGASRG
ncbi:MAG: SagB/ThcOx family dehydrogenase [Sandaracinaceae bacterium]|nr:SagB/ThcOx family dehydrogenase [Sandaracinaceae bacterium]